LYILNLSKNNLNRYSKINGFWSLEIMTLQKAFYAPYSSNVILYKKSVNLFLYNFMKEGLFSIPYLKYFFVVSRIQNLKLISPQVPISLCLRISNAIARKKFKHIKIQFSGPSKKFRSKVYYTLKNRPWIRKYREYHL